MHGEGVAVSQLAWADVVGPEVLETAVVHAGQQFGSAGIDGVDAALLRGDHRSVGSRCQRHDAVAGTVGRPTGGDQLGAREATE
jgi:hypothetical protein